jgi:hypothetical protein
MPGTILQSLVWFIYTRHQFMPIIMSIKAFQTVFTYDTLIIVELCLTLYYHFRLHENIGPDEKRVCVYVYRCWLQ